MAPAAARFSQSGSTSEIAGLLRRAQRHLSGIPPEQRPFSSYGQDFDRLQSALDIIEGREFYGPATGHSPPTPDAQTSDADLRSYIESQVYSLLFDALCVWYDAGVPAEQVLTRGRLLPYLYERSSTLEDAFCGGLRGEPLPLLPHMEMLSRDDVSSLLRALESISPPDDDVERRNAELKLKALQQKGGILVSSEFAEAFGPPPSQALQNLMKLLKASLADSKLAVIQSFQ